MFTTPEVQFAEPPRAVLGCIQIGTDFVLDSEGPGMIARIHGVELRLQKVQLDDVTLSKEMYIRNAPQIAVAAAALQPADRCTVWGVACTSFAFSIGADAVDAQFRKVAPDSKSTDMFRGQFAALRALGAKKISLVTPYVEALSADNARVLEESGEVSVVSPGSYNKRRL